LIYWCPPVTEIFPELMARSLNVGTSIEIEGKESVALVLHFRL
jgi:hypothetical protein